MKMIVVCFVLLAACSTKADEERFIKELETDVNDHLIQDALTQLSMVIRRGDAMEICVHTGHVANLYLQAKQEHHYRQFKDAETRACRLAGLR